MIGCVLNSSFAGRVVFGQLLLLAALFLCQPAWAESPEERGLAIAREADRRDMGFGDSSSRLQMILRNKQGEVATREMRGKVLEKIEDGDKSIFVFDDPMDVKGTALLTFSHKIKTDDQWLYLPALKRVKRISSRNRSGPFVGSEFAYEDMASQEVEKYHYKYLREEQFEGRDTFVLERYPVDKKSGYTRQVVWLDQDEYRIWKIDFYDRKDSLLKTLSFSDYSQYLGKHWRAHRMDMVNHQTGKSTRLNWSDYRFGSGYDDNDFNRNSLAKMR